MNRWLTLESAIGWHGDSVLVTVEATQGSAPRGTDAWMIVTAHGIHGSIGGGTLEWKAMAEARSMLNKGRSKHISDFVLGPDLGQCCGGRVRVAYEKYTAADVATITSLALKDAPSLRSVYLFGAGHVGRALVLALAPLPFSVTWIDPRPNAFPAIVPGQVTMLQTEDPVSTVSGAADASFAFIMTHSHALDLAVVDAALRNARFAAVGVIGSATKRARFEKRLSESGVAPQRISKLICPIGVPGITSKLPHAIATAVAAQALQLDANLAQQSDLSLKAS